MNDRRPPNRCLICGQPAEHYFILAGCYIGDSSGGQDNMPAQCCSGCRTIPKDLFEAACWAELRQEGVCYFGPDWSKQVPR